MFDLIEAPRERMEPHVWHSWIAAIMALLALANLALFALHHQTRGTLAFASVEALAIIIVWAFSLSGRIRAWTSFVVTLICLAILYWVRL